MPVDLPALRAPRKEFRVTGRFVLISIVTFFLVVAAVNATMMTIAIRTFPGAEARNGYDISQAYNREIASARAQHSRGWGSEITLLRSETAGGVLTLTLRDKDGQPVSGLQLEARLRHPSSQALDRTLAMIEPGPGLYRVEDTGLTLGAWDILLVGRLGGEKVYTAKARTVLR